jgi:hypothetical protein
MTKATNTTLQMSDAEISARIGPIISKHPFSKLKPLRFGGGTVEYIAYLMIAGFVLAALFINGTISKELWINVVGTLVCGGLGVAMAVWLWRGLFPRYEVTTAVLGERGILKQQKQKVEVILFDQIKQMYQEHAYGDGMIYQTYTVIHQDDTKVVLDNAIDNIDSLAERLQKHVVDHLLPAAQRAYAAGQTLDFGALRISNEGLWQGKNFLAWQFVEKVTLNNGLLKIKRHKGIGDWAYAGVDRIANLVVFLKLVDDITPITRQ